jgi:hypothetical protein
VRQAEEIADERIVHVARLDLLVVPGQIEAQVDEEAAIPVEGNERADRVVEDVQGLGIQPEDVTDGVLQYVSMLPNSAQDAQ